MYILSKTVDISSSKVLSGVDGGLYEHNIPHLRLLRTRLAVNMSQQKIEKIKDN